MKQNRIFIGNFDGDVVGQFVRYLHSGSLNETLAVSAPELLEFADEYEVDGLKLLVQDRLSKSITIKTVCKTFELAMSFADTAALREACEEYIRSNIKAVKSCGGWRKMKGYSKSQFRAKFF